MQCLRQLIPALVMMLMLCALPGHIVAQETWSKQLEEQVKAWANELARHDQRFQVWPESRLEWKPLGANQHQWLVVFRADKPLGYMIVGEVPHGESRQAPVFALLEYGLGEYVLFDERLAPNEPAEAIYDGFASRWQVSTAAAAPVRLVNAKTGEVYPAGFLPDPPAVQSLPASELVTAGKQLLQAHVFARQEGHPFDRIGWMRKHPLAVKSAQELWAQLIQQSRGETILQVSLYGEQVTAPFLLGSLHLWSGQVGYAGVWEDGLRFLPVAYTNRIGSWIP